jgi:hypothetical protein
MDPFTKARLAELHSLNEATRILLDERIARREAIAEAHAEDVRASRPEIDFMALPTDAFEAVVHGALTGETLPGTVSASEINQMIAAVSAAEEDDYGF